MKIHRFRTEDAKEVSSLIKNNFIKLDLGGHTQEGIRLQIKGNNPKNLIKRSKYIDYFVSIDKNKVTGICGYDREKIHTLFVDIHYHGKGIGRQLLEKVIEEGKKKGVKNFKTLSTFYAEGFYIKSGFKRIRELSFPEETRDIILIEMEKTYTSIC